ncbi:hypothetical protein FRB90_012131, partial [Tulasnella sp. 427]
MLPSPPLSPPTSPPTQKRSVYQQPQHPARSIPRQELPPTKQAKMARYPNYVPEEETIRNNHLQRYPKQQRLLALKKASVVDVANAP